MNHLRDSNETRFLSSNTVVSSAPVVQSSNVSFEFFPPSSEKMEKTLWDAVQRLKSLKPRFVSVTYGADGSTRERTHAIVKRIMTETDLVVAPHITCIGASRGEIRELAQQYWQDGIRHVVALRGDLPADKHAPGLSKDGYRFAWQLVEDLMKVADFDITVAAYPEVHPEALSAKQDLENLQQKFDAGASRAFTQFFFVSDYFLRFRDQCSLYGLDDKIVPGVLPISQFTQVERFATACGTKIPTWLKQRFDGLDDEPLTRQLVSASVAIDQVSDLFHHGVNEFHFYTLNRAELTYAICHTLGVHPDRANHIATANTGVPA